MTWNASRKRLAARYLAACALYVTIGALSPSFMLSWPVAAVYFLTTLWLLPLAVRRARRQ